MFEPVEQTDIRENLATDIRFINRNGEEIKRTFDTVYVNHILEKGLDYVYVLELINHKNRHVYFVYLPFNFINKSSFPTEDYYTVHKNNENPYAEMEEPLMEDIKRCVVKEMQCPYCGNAMDDATRICGICGAFVG